ncbi:helix-turn-helix transcriptional regulator [Streptomyces pini]|uniref:DNA-binding transcriptional regulator, XRE-family HTH domain n=1 Tax=Streptomyces pini TaxID=1520580 RepID=A0A1I4EKN4_9ACTN|nr:helix-turn-helix transcriptional regulator [Streptomyces pini]SFL04731.1 DNA-binding transcriptional regulator, XRE-family HTH domain [Streptomyces pini]
MDGASIRELRHSRGMTQEEFAAAVGTSRFMVNRWEAGVHRPNLESLKKIAQATGKPLGEIVEEVKK